MTSRPLDFSELSPEVQSVIRKNYDVGAAENQDATVAQQTKVITARDEKAIGQKRKQSGSDFEAELDVTHAAYEFKKWGKIRRNHIPTRVVGHNRMGPKRVPIGPAHVDRTGWVSVDAGYPGAGAVWHGIPWSSPSATKRLVPVAFDAKVLGEKTKRGWYHHDEKLQHQLHDLKAAAEAGEYAFLLILERRFDRLFAVPIQLYYAALLSGSGVRLYDVVEDNVCAPFFPSIEKSGQGGGIGWDWIELLDRCAPQ